MSAKSVSKSEKSGLSQYMDLEQIGKGGFGIVFKARDKFGKYVAIKQIPKNRNGARAKEEIKAMRSLQGAKGNSRVVKYFTDFEDEQNTYIVMEYCEHGTLRDYIKKRGRLRSEIAANVLSQLVEGLELMHKTRIMHRDLTASNVLISRKDGDQLSVKLSDFGLAKEAPRKPILATCVGTPGYVAPQVREKQKYGKGADVFSLGAILYAMVVGSDPPKSVVFDQEGQPVFDYARVSCIDDTALDLLKRMMCRDEQDRILLSDIDRHPFMEAAQQKALEKMGLDASLLRSCSRERNSADKENQLVAGKYTNRRGSVVAMRTVMAGSKIRRSVASTAMENYRTAPSNKPVLQAPPLPLPPAPPPGRSPLRQRVQAPVVAGAKAVQAAPKKLIWPFPSVSHLAYIRSNKLGRFAFLNIPQPVEDLNKTPPAAVYEMADENGCAKRIFEIYYNWTDHQRLLVFEPKRLEKVPDHRSNIMLEKNTQSEIRIRSEKDLANASEEIRLGYKRMCQFIPLAESRISQGTLRNAFGNAGYTIELKYNGNIEMSAPGGRRVVKKPGDDGPLGASLKEKEQQIFRAGAAKLHETASTRAFQEVAARGAVMKPFVISW